MRYLRSLIKKVLFVGLGGAGQRHLRVFQRLLPPDTEWYAYRATRKTPLLKPDFNIDYAGALEERYGVRTFGSLDDALDARPDLAVIATPTSMHLDAAVKAAQRGSHVFVEKPLSHSLEGIDSLQSALAQNRLVFSISFQRRFQPQLRMVKDMLDANALGQIITAVFDVGSYVPSWHPYESFEDLYACRKELGGGVLLTESHELDLCFWYFGLPESVRCTGGNISGVPMDVEDTARVCLKYPGFSAEVNLCFMDKHVHRELRIQGTRGCVKWTAEGNRLCWIDYRRNRETHYAEPEYENDAMFFSQASHFLDHVRPGDTPQQLNGAVASLRIIEAAKASMVSGVESSVHAANRSAEVIG